MSEKIFRVSVLNEQTMAAGTICEMQLPASLPRRILWCYYDLSVITAGDESWIRFYSKGELSAELPAAYIFAGNIRFGMASWRDQVLDPVTFGGGGSSCLFFVPQNTTNHPAVIQPFYINVEADAVTLETNKGGVTSAILAVLSFPR